MDTGPNAHSFEAGTVVEELLVKVGSEVKKGDPLASISTENLKELIGTAHLYMAIKECHKEHGFPVEAACELIHVARSAYYVPCCPLH